MFQQLSDTELMIMEYLWSQNIPKTFSEIKAFFEATTNKNWKKQTLSTFLLRLVKKGVLYANHQEAKVTYYPALSSEEILPTIHFSDNPNLFPWFFNFF